MAEIRIQRRERHAWPWLLMALLAVLVAWLVLRTRGDRSGDLAIPPAAAAVEIAQADAAVRAA